MGTAAAARSSPRPPPGGVSPRMHMPAPRPHPGRRTVRACPASEPTSSRDELDSARSPSSSRPVTSCSGLLPERLGMGRSLRRRPALTLSSKPLRNPVQRSPCTPVTRLVFVEPECCYPIVLVSCHHVAIWVDNVD